MGYNTCKSMGRVLCVVRRQDICMAFIQRRPNVFDAGPTLHKVIQMFCVQCQAVSTYPQ